MFVRICSLSTSRARFFCNRTPSSPPSGLEKVGKTEAPKKLVVWHGKRKEMEVIVDETSPVEMVGMKPGEEHSWLEAMRSAQEGAARLRDEPGSTMGPY